jgi:hypothetical protein
MNPICAATLSVANLDVATENYARWLGYQIVERHPFDNDMAAAYGAPRAAGLPSAILRPASGRNVYFRLIEQPAAPDYRPMRTYGWSALELCITDVHATHDRLRDSPFAVIGPPSAIAGLPTIHPMQVQAPDGEILFLTEIKAGGPGSGLPEAQAPIDTLFICVLACRDMAAMAAWAGHQLDAIIAPEIAIPYRTISRAFDLPPETPHRITTATKDDAIFLEFDHYPPETEQRTALPGLLVPGVSIVSLLHPDLDTVPGPWLVPPIVREGTIYQGRRAGLLRAPEGALLELVEQP